MRRPLLSMPFSRHRIKERRQLPLVLGVTTASKQLSLVIKFLSIARPSLPFIDNLSMLSGQLATTILDSKQ
jgi:hypothetical protein